MITIPETVEQIIKNSYLLEEGLLTGVINLSSLARKIKPEIEKKLLKDASYGAIVMAIKRLTKKIKPSKQITNVFKETPNMIVRSNLIEFTVSNSDFLIKKHKKLLELIHLQKNYFFTITQGVFETAIIVNKECKNIVINIFKEEKIIHELSNLSSITIKLPEENVSIPGVYYFILKSLAWEKINVIDVVSTYSEFTIILEDKEIDHAFSVLKKTLTKNDFT